MGIQENLRSLMNAKNLTEDDVAKICGVKQPSVNAWLKKGSISQKNIIKLSQHFKLSVDDLLRGSANRINPIPTKQIPLLSWVQAGLWADNGDNDYSEYIPTDSSVPDNCFALRVNGDSMTSLTGGKSIPDGAIVIVEPTDKSPEDLNHKVVIIADADNQTTMKELIFDGTTGYLKPWNQSYEKIRITEGMRIIGYVIRFQVTL